jgi:hypothetical protein
VHIANHRGEYMYAPDQVEDLDDVALWQELRFELVAGAWGQTGQLARIEGQAAETHRDDDLRWTGLR